MNKDNKIISATWIKHNRRSNPVPDTQVEYVLDDGTTHKGNSNDLVWDAFGNGIVKYRVIGVAKIGTPRMMDKTVEVVLVLVYINFGKVMAIKTLRYFKELSLVSAMQTIEKYIPSKEYARYLLNKILAEKSTETVKATPVDL